jgi:hypothetical protein
MNSYETRTLTADDMRRIREKNLRDIQNLYGVEDGVGREMLMDVASKYLLHMLPDAAIAELAQRQRDMDAGS